MTGAIEDPQGAMVDAESVVVEGGGCCSIESIVEMSLDTLFSSWLSCLLVENMGLVVILY